MAFFNIDGLPAFQAGFSQVCITPPIGVSMYGYYHDRIGTYIKDDLYIHAAVIGNGTHRLALASLDIGAPPREEFRQAKALIAERTGIPASHVLLCCTHTHTGPVISRNGYLPCCPEWLDALPGHIADAVAQANDALADVLLVPARTIAEDVGSNRLTRRPDGTEKFSKDGIGPAGPVDKELQALRVCDLEGNTRGILINFAQHADNIGGGTADFISADWPGQVARTISQVYGDDVVTVFLNGCCGDLNMSFDHPSRRARNQLPRNISMGRAIASLAVACTEQAEPLSASNTIQADLRVIDIPYYTRDKAFYDMVEEARLNSPRKELEPVVLKNRYWTHDGQTAHVPVQVMRLGDILIVGLPGEIFTRWGLELKHWSPAPFTFVVELANDYFQYVPTTDQAQRGAYGALPVLSRMFEADGGRRMVDLAQVMLYDVWNTPEN